MAIGEKAKKLYDALKADGADVGTEQEFNDWFYKPGDEGYKNRKSVYDAFKADGADVGVTYEEFRDWLGLKPAQQSEKIESAGPSESAQQSEKIESAGQTEESGWEPTVADKIRMHNTLNQASRTVEGLKSTVEQTKRLQESMTDEGRKNLRDVRMAEKLAGRNPDVLGISFGSAESQDGGQKKSEDGSLKPMTAPQAVGVKLVDGKLQTEWMLGDGSTTTDIVVANAAAVSARGSRLQHEFVGRMRDNGLNPAKKEDVNSQSLIDGVLSGNNIEPTQREGILEAMKLNGLNPKDSSHVKYFVLGDVQSILEVRRENANARLKELLAQREDERYSDDSFLGIMGQTGRAMTQGMHPHPQAESGRTALDKEIEMATGEVAEIEQTLREYRNADNAEKRSFIGKVLQGLKDGITDPNTWTFGVYGASVNKAQRDAASSVSDGENSENARNLLMTGLLTQQLRQEMPTPGGWYTGGKFVGEMIGAPETYLSMGFGSLAKKAAVKGAAKVAAKNVGGEVAERLFSRTLVGRMGLAGVESGANFFAFEGLGDLREQMIDGGYYDDNNKFHEGISWGRALGRGGHGLIMGTTMGLFGAGWGNVVNKMVKGTDKAVERVLGGQSAAVKSAANTAAKATVKGVSMPVSVVGEGTIFAIPEVWEIQQMDDKELDKLLSEKDAEYGKLTDERERKKMREEMRDRMQVDAWSESLANIAGMKIAGKVKEFSKNPVGKISDMHDVVRGLADRNSRSGMSLQEHVREMMNRSPLDVNLTREEVAELHNAGYGKLADIFEKKDAPSREVLEQQADGTFRPTGIEVDEKYKELDGYDTLLEVLDNKGVSQAARAKLYYMATGHMLPMGTVMGYRMDKDSRGVWTVRSMSGDGEVVTARSFKSESAAKVEADKIRRQMEFNSIDVGERYKNADLDERAKMSAYSEVAEKFGFPGDGARAVDVIYERYLSGDVEGLTEEQREVHRSVGEMVDEVLRRNLEDSSAERPIELRAGIKERTGYDVDDVLEKEPGVRTADEQAALDEYMRSLYPSDETSGSRPRRGIDGDGGSPESPLTRRHGAEGETERPIGRAVMKFEDREVEVMSGRVVMHDDGSMINNEASDRTIVIRDMETGQTEMVSPEAILTYVRYDEDYFANQQPPQGAGTETTESGTESGSRGTETVLNSELDSVNLQNGDGLEQSDDTTTLSQGSHSGNGVADDAAGATSSVSDRSDIRVYEAGLAAARDAHSGDSERNRREAESERLVNLAKENGQYKTREEVRAFGERYLKPTGESEVIINREEGKVYKIKDPYAKSPMKGDVQPEDAILEHHVHNKYFPDTAYTFEGISDEVGDVRIILSQEYRDSYGQPTQEQIDAALAEKGLYQEGKYTYGNDEISVTDVSGDNALLGADGKVYFIDPVINFKKPVSEILGENEAEVEGKREYTSGEITIRNADGTESRGWLTGYIDEEGKHEYYVAGIDDKLFYATDSELDNILSDFKPYAPAEQPTGKTEQSAISTDNENDEQGNILPKSTESGLNLGENGENPTENGVSGAESVPNSSNSVENVQQSALAQVPLNENGKPDFTKVEPGVAWDALVEKTSNEQTAQGFADNMVKRSEEALKKVERAKPKNTDDIDEFMEAEAQRQANIDNAKATLDHWKKVAGENQRRQEEVKRQSDEVRRSEEAEERDWKETLRKMDKHVRVVADELRECPEAVEILQDMNPHDIYEAASLVLSTHKILLNDDGHGGFGFYRELGSNMKGEAKKLFGLFASKEKGGKSIAWLAGDIMEELCSEHGIPYDNQEAYSALLDVISSSGTRGDIWNYIANNRIRQAKEVYEHYVSYYDGWDDYMFEQSYHMTREEYDAYEEHMQEELKKLDENFDADEYYGNIADEMAERELAERQLSGLKRTEGDAKAGDNREDGTHDGQGAGTGDGSGREVLSGQEIDNRPGVSAYENGQGVSAGNREESVGSQRAISAGASGGDGVRLTERGGGTESDSGTGAEVTPKFDRTIPTTPEAQRSAISRIIDFAKTVKDRVERAVIGGITKRQAKDFAEQGIDVDETWVHSFESSAVGHNQKHHGNSKAEEARGQIAITAEDYARIPEILENYDKVSKSTNTTHRNGNDVIVYEKEFEDGYVYYLEEKRDNRKSLAFQTMYKKKKGTDSSDGLMRNASTSTPTATPDNLSSNSERKVNNFASVKQVVEGESSAARRTWYGTEAEMPATPGLSATRRMILFNEAVDAYKEGQGAASTYDAIKSGKEFGYNDFEKIYHDNTREETFNNTVEYLPAIFEYLNNRFDSALKSQRGGGTESDSGTGEAAVEPQEQRYDNMGNPIDNDGKLIIEDVESLSEITDDNFMHPTRTVGLPSIPENVDKAIGANGRKAIIKKNIFVKNRDTHGELTPSESRDILNRALYNPNLVGTNQPIRRPDYKVAIQTGDKNAVVVLDVYAGKENVEIVGWRKVDAKGLEKMKRQAEREGGQFLILSPNEGSAAALSALPSDVSSERKVTNSASDKQVNEGESSEKEPPEKAPEANEGTFEAMRKDLREQVAELYRQGEEEIGWYKASKKIVDLFEEYAKSHKLPKHFDTWLSRCKEAFERIDSKIAGAHKRSNDFKKLQSEVSKLSNNELKGKIADYDDAINGLWDSYRAQMGKELQRNILRGHETIGLPGGERAAEILNTVSKLRAERDMMSDILRRREAAEQTGGDIRILIERHNNVGKDIDAWDETEKERDERVAIVKEIGELLSGMSDKEILSLESDKVMSDFIESKSLNYGLDKETRAPFERATDVFKAEYLRQIAKTLDDKFDELPQSDGKKRGGKKFAITDVSSRYKEHAGSALSGVYHDGESKVAVSSDTHVMVVSGKDYDSRHKGKSISAKGEVLKGNYPPYKRVLPIAENNIASAPMDESVEARLTSGMKVAKAQTGERGEDMPVLVKMGEGVYGVFRAEDLRNFFRAASHIGAERLELNHTPYGDKLVARGKGDDVAFVMSMNPQERMNGMKLTLSDNGGVRKSVGSDVEGNAEVYEITKGLVESAGVPVVEVSEADAMAMLAGNKKTPFAGQPNRANEKLTSGSVLLSAKGDSSSNANVPSEASANIVKDTQRTKNNIRKFNNGDAIIETNSLSDAIRTIGSLFSMRNRGGSRYTILQTDGGNTVAVRLSDHAANGNNFGQDNAENNLSIVIERRRFDAKPSEIEFTEATIPLSTFEAQPKAVVDAIVKGVEEVLADRSFTLSPEIGIVENKGNTGAESPKARIHKRDKAYMDAVERGDMQTAQRLVEEAAKEAGYIAESEYQGTSAYNGAAPFNGYEWTKEERKEKWDNGEFEGDWTLGDNLDFMGEDTQLHFLLNHPNGYYSASSMQKESIQALRSAIRSGRRKVKVYRSVPSDVKEGTLRDGDWVTPSLSYAKDNAAIHGWGRKYRIIEQEVDFDELWWDGNDVNEWGYDSGSNSAYKNTKNNRKLLDTVTYDDNGNIIPLSKRFNAKNSDIRYLRTPEGKVYGWTIGGKVYLNRDAMNPETPIHEYTHLWDDMVRRENPELWNRGKELMKETPLWDEVKNDPNYADIADDEDAIASEVHSRLTGKAGKERIEQMQREAETEKDYVEKAKKISLVNRLKRWLSDMFKGLKKTLGKWSKSELRDLTEEDFVNMTLRDLADGMNPRTEMRRGEQMRSVTEANPMLDDYHTGIREREDVKTFDEMLSEAEKAGETMYPDMSLESLRQAKQEGQITIYSSKPIETGAFVTPSRMNAEDYAGEGKVYEKRVAVDDVAWIDDSEGQYAPVSETTTSTARMSAAMSHGKEGFDAKRERAVKERGIVTPGLADMEVNVVKVPKHDFTGTGKEALKTAEQWAKENIVGIHAATDSEGVEFEYSISNDAVEKYVSKSATDKSANIGVHLAVMKKLPEVISESIEVEIHPDYIKNETGKRIHTNDINESSLVHRFFGAIDIEGKPYRVKTTMREYGDKKMATTAHSYEVTQIELLEAPSDNTSSTAEPLAMTSNSSITVAKLLQNVEKSYDKGVKLLDASEKALDLVKEPSGATYQPSLFDSLDEVSMSERKRSDVTPRVRVKQLSLFGDDEGGMSSGSRPQHRDENVALGIADGAASGIDETPMTEAATRADAAIDEYVDKFAEIYDRYSRLAEKNGDGSTAIIERMESEMLNLGDGLEHELENYYREEGNTDEDSRKMARDMSTRVRADVTLQMTRKGERTDVLSQEAEGVRETSEGIQKHKTAGGETIDFEHLEIGLPRLKEGEFSLVERRFTEDGMFPYFTGKSEVKSAEDVAYIFRSLENSAVENTFAVLVKDGRPMILHIGMGAQTMSVVDMSAVRAGFEAYGADKIYLVHNHPSGALRPSPQDEYLVRVIRDMFGAEVTGDGVIIDVTSGRYCTFGGDRETNGEHSYPSYEDSEEVRHSIGRFSKTVFSKDYDFDSLATIRGSQDVAAYVSSRRLGDGGKLGYLLLDNANHVVGNILTSHVGISNPKEMATELVRQGIAHGARRAVLYGDKIAGIGMLNIQVKKMSGGSLDILDAIQIDRERAGEYVSAHDERMLEPGSEYGALADMPEERMTDEVVSDKIERLFDAAVSGDLKGKSIEVGKLTKDGRAFLEKLSGIKIKEEISFVLNPSDLQHIHNRHFGENEKDSRNIPLTTEDVRMISEVISHPDNVIYAKEETGDRRNMFFFLKGISDGSYNLLEVYTDRRGNLTSKSYFKSKEGVSQRAMLLKESSALTSVTDGATLLDGAKLPKFFDNPTIADKKEFDIRFKEVERINARQMEMAQTSEEAKQSHAEQLSKKFGAPIRVVTDVTEITHSDSKMQECMRRSAGWYDTHSREVVLVLPNNRSVEEVAKTVFHEVVAHKGLREMIGEENYDAFCDEVYSHLKEDLKEEVDREATRSFQQEPEKGYEYAKRKAVDEMFGRMAEKGFEDFTKAERGIWAKLKSKVLEAINKFLGTLKLPKWVKLGDNELRYMLWKSHERMSGRGDYVAQAKDVAKRNELGLTAERKVAGEERMTRQLQADVARGERIAEKRERIEKLRKSEPVEVIENMIPKGLDLTDRKAVKESLRNNIKGEYTNEDDGNVIHVSNRGIKEVTSHGMSDEAHVKSLFAIGSLLEKSIFIDERINEKDHTDFEKYRYYVCGVKIDGDDYTAKLVVGQKNGHSYYDHRLSRIEKGKLINSLNGLSNTVAKNQLPKGEYKGTTLESLLQVNEPEVGYGGMDIRFRDGERGETSDIWKDQSVGFKERITNAAIRLSNNQSGDLTLRNDAMRAIGGNLTSLRRAMAAQRAFDQSTVKRVADLARILMQNGYLSGMTSGEMQRLISAVKNSVGHKEVKESVQKVMDIMVQNQLRNGEATLRQLLAIKGSKVDARGVEVQGMLDVDGQRTMEVVKEAIELREDDINDRIAEAMNRMSDPDNTIADKAALEYAGLQISLDYVKNIADSKAEEKVLRDELRKAKEDKDAGRMTDDAYNQFVEATEDAIRKNKIERAEAYFNLVGRLSDTLRGSIENAKSWRESEKKRIAKIHHLANADMEGREPKGQLKNTVVQKLVNSPLVQWPAMPMANFDQMLRLFGNKHSNGYGYLYDYFMRSWVDAADKEQVLKEEYQNRLDAKAAEIFGKRKVWWNGGLKEVAYGFRDLNNYAEGKKSIKVSMYDGAKEREYEITQPQMLYLYAVEKMTMGMATNRRIGLTEDMMAEIERVLDPKLKAYADWAQEELLPELGAQMSVVHERMFGALMDSIEKYFTFVRHKYAIKRTEENGKDSQPNDKISTTTGAIKKRVPSVAVWDFNKMNFFDVLAKHLYECSHWISFAEMNRDLSTLLSYSRFEQQVMGITSVYGSGEKLLKRFKNVCAIATDCYEPKRSKADALAVQTAKGVTMGKIAFRTFTAAKQVLSLPAFFGEVNAKYLAADLAQGGIPALQWAWKNLPNFRKRVLERTAGDYRLRENEYDNAVMNAVWAPGKLGMLPNIAVDAWTIALGSHGHYQTMKAKYLRWGMDEAKAERRAIQDAVMCFNKSQQSSEGPFMAPIQIDHTWFSTMSMLFRNSSTSYTREAHAAARNLKRIMDGEVDVDFMAKQWLRMMEVKTFNERFNEELAQQQAGTLPQGHIYQLGKPGGILQSAQIQDLPIELSAERLALKASESYRSGHPFPLEAVKNLPRAINNPIAVFDSATREGAKVILTTLRHNGNKFVVALEAQRTVTGRGDRLEVNNILSLYPKDSVIGIMRWIANGNMVYCDHKKMRAFFSVQWPDYIVDGENALDIVIRPKDQQRINLADVDTRLLEDVANVVNNFDNPTIPTQKVNNEWSEEDWSKARKYAKDEIRHDTVKNTANLAIFGWVLPWLWRIGGIAPFLLLSGDDDEKKKELDSINKQSAFGVVEGLLYGDVASDALSTGLGLTDNDWSRVGRNAPMIQDISNMLQRVDKDKAAAYNDVLNILVGMGTGVNLQTLTEWVVAIVDASDDRKTQRETALLVARLMNAPQSQLNRIYLEELGDEASNLTPAEIAERYAKYQMMHDAPLTDWMRSNEERDSVMEKKRNVVLKKAKTDINERVSTQKTDELLKEYDAYNRKYSELSKLDKIVDNERYIKGMRSLYSSHSPMVHVRVKAYKRDMKELTNRYLNTTRATERDSIVEAMFGCRDKMLQDVAEMEWQSNR